MGQQDIIDLFSKERGKKFTSTEISIKLGRDFSASVIKMLQRLAIDPFFELKKDVLTKEEKVEKYGRNVPTKIYVYWIE